MDFLFISFLRLLCRHCCGRFFWSGELIDFNPAHGYKKLFGTGKIDSADDISNTGAACNESRMLINHPVPYLAGFFVTLVAWADKMAAQTNLEFFNSRFIKD